jgi:hypothetical protein
MNFVAASLKVKKEGKELYQENFKEIFERQKMFKKNVVSLENPTLIDVTKNRKSILSDVCFMNIPSFRRNSL